MGKIIRMSMDELNHPLTNEQIEMLKKAANSPIVYDEDCPEFTDEELKQFRRVHELKDQERRKGIVSLRLSQSSIKKAKALGPKYTAVLARMIEIGLDDPEMIKKCL